MKSTPPALPAVVAPQRPTGIVAARAPRPAVDGTAATLRRRPTARLGEAGSLARPVGSTLTGPRGGTLGSYVDTYA